VARFTVTAPLNMEWRGRRLVGTPSTTYRIPDEFYAEFLDDFVNGKSAEMPGLVWISQDESTAGGGAHPDLAAHDSLGLFTQVEFEAHTAAGDPHAVYALDADLTNHEGAADPHTGYRRESDDHTHASSGLQAGQIAHSALSGVTADQHHVQQHAVTSTADHTFPGGSTFLRADGTFASPPGGSEAFPVGSVFIAVVSTSPSALLGYGTWAAFAAGRVLVGIDAGQTEFDVVEETGGAKTHTLTTAEMPAHGHVQDSHNHTQDAHTHTQNAHLHDEYRNSATTGGLDGWAAGDTSTNTATLTGYDTGSTTATNQNATATNQAATATNQNTGGGGAHNNLQPYIVVYMWKRTA
jgi:microcystin-dependent protein